MDFCNAKNLTCTPKNKEEKLTKMWNQTVPIPNNGAKIWSRENRTQKVDVLKLIFKVCVLWLPRYFCYSIEVKRVESTGTGSDRNFTGMFMCVLKFLQCLKESKEKKKQRLKREVRWKQRSDKHRRMIFMILFVYLKQSKKRKKTHGY